ncbi:MAG: hypothetical protein QXG78_00175 [Candidatus Methanomethyliaceae archaeon]
MDKCFNIRICINLLQEHIEFLRNIIEIYEIESISQFVKKCIETTIERFRGKLIERANQTV